MKIIAIIPARFASTRFPGKPLVEIEGKTMIRRVYEQAEKATLIDEVIVATDNDDIAREVERFGGKVVITSAKHNNGTERCAEAAANLDADVIINIQGDEPLIQPTQIDTLAGVFKDNPQTQLATLIKQSPLNEQLQNPSRIKVVVDKNMNALYFSRSVIPFVKPAESGDTVFYKHIGIYGYSKAVLLDIVKLPPTMLELAESLEQLRWLENGYKIKCALTNYEGISVDTPEDLEIVKHLLRIKMA